MSLSKIIKYLIPAALSLSLSSAAIHAQENQDKQYTFSVVPQQAASKLARSWGPIMKYIAKETGYKVRFVTAPNIPEFENRLAQGEYDFAYMNPYHYVVFSKAPGYRAMNKARDKQIKGILVKRKDNDKITSLEDLKGQQMAFPSPAAFAASILPRAELKRLNVDIQPKYVSSHDSVYRNVSQSIMVAGGGVKRTFNAFDTKQKEKLEIFWTSKGYTPHAIAAHPDIPDEVVSSIQQALVKMESSDSGKDMLKNLKIKGWQQAIDSDWDDVRALQIPDLSKPVE